MTAPDFEAGEAAAGGVEPFASLSALKNAHEELLAAASDLTHGIGDAILAFIERARATGALLDPAGARREAQQIIDYWAAEMFGLPGTDEVDLGGLRLASYDDSRAKEQGPHAADIELERRLDREKQLVRLAASARMARDADWSQGYLLTGDALDNAKPFAADDESVREFVERSDVFERKQERAQSIRKNVVIAVLSVLLLVAVGAATLAWRRGYEIAQANKELIEANDRINDQILSIRKDSEDLRGIIANLREEKQLALETRRQRDQLEVGLSAATRSFSELLKSRALNRDQVPTDILKSLDDAASSQQIEPDRSAFEGYKADFLGAPLAMPRLSEAASAIAFGKGEPLPYVNYSVVTNARRKIAFFTASNLDRERRVALPRVRDRSSADPRLPADAQADAAWFESPEIDEGHLVTRQEIAWGSYFAGSSGEASGKALAMVDVFPNLTPQYDVFNRGGWSGLERWVLESHNAGANRVTIFTGPVLSDSDPVLNGVQLPRSFWKVAVSKRVDTAAELIVDAFVMPQASVAGEKLPEVLFDPTRFRVSIAEIEQMTGLDFGDVLRTAGNVAATQTQAQTSEGDRLAAQVQRVDTLDATAGAAAAQQLVDRITDPSLPETELRKAVAALVYRVQNEAIWALSPRGRRDLLKVMASVSEPTWRHPDFSRLRADARRAAGDLERTAKAGSTVIDDETRQALTRIEANVGLTPAPLYQVDFQFAGMTRADAVEISARLKALGWKILGEERTVRAAGVNEVRYGDADDKDAAELLVADLQALGLGEVKAAKRNAAIKKGNLEIWISR